MKLINYFTLPTLAISCLCLAPKPTLAQLVTGNSTSTVYQYDIDLPISVDIKSLNNTQGNPLIPTTVSSSAFLPNIGKSNGSITGSMGTLKVYSFTNNQTSSFAQTYNNISAVDYLTVTAPGLAFGTPVSLLVTLDITGTHSIPATLVDGGYVAQAGAYFIPCNSNYSSCVFHQYDSLTDPLNPLLGVLSTTVGQKLEVIYGLNANTYVDAFSAIKPAEVDYTARYFIDSLTDGIVLTSASGYDYSSPKSPTSIPEPSAILSLLTLGVVGVTSRLLGKKLN